MGVRSRLRHAYFRIILYSSAYNEYVPDPSLIEYRLIGLLGTTSYTASRISNILIRDGFVYYAVMFCGSFRNILASIHSNTILQVLH